MSAERGDRARRRAFVAALFGMTLAGTVVRLVWALRARPWISAPDALSWQILLKEAHADGIRWDQLVHYPHELGAALFSLLALGLGSVGPLPSLAVATLVADTLLRGTALALVASAYDRKTTLWLAAFWLVSLPVLLPWSVLPQLHAHAAIWPIVLVWIAQRGLEGRGGAAFLGATTGLAIATSLDSLVLLPVASFLALRDARERGIRRLAEFAGCLAGALLLIVVARGFLDLGFAGSDPLAIRGVSLRARAFPSPFAMAHWMACVSQLPSIGGVPAIATRLAWSLLAGAGLVLAAFRRERGTTAGLALLATFLVVTFASPFFTPAPGDAMSYRHAAYVVPLAALLVLRGFAGRRGAPFAALLVLLGALGTVASARSARPPAAGDRAAGWILARKLGHDPARLARLLHLVPGKRHEVAFGYGWGAAAARLDGTTPPAPDAVAAIVGLGRALPGPEREPYGEGARFAFAPGITPRLDSGHLPELEEALRALRPAAP